MSLSTFHLSSAQQFFDQISYMKYGYIGLCLNEYQDLKYVCGSVAVPVCTEKTVFTQVGEATMKNFGYDRYTIDYCVGCMIVYIAVCRISSYLALRFLKM